MTDARFMSNKEIVGVINGDTDALSDNTNQFGANQALGLSECCNDVCATRFSLDKESTTMNYFRTLQRQ